MENHIYTLQKSKEMYKALDQSYQLHWEFWTCKVSVMLENLPCGQPTRGACRTDCWIYMICRNLLLKIFRSPFPNSAMVTATFDLVSISVDAGAGSVPWTRHCELGHFAELENSVLHVRSHHLVIHISAARTAASQTEGQVQVCHHVPWKTWQINITTEPNRDFSPALEGELEVLGTQEALTTHKFDLVMCPPCFVCGSGLGLIISP